VVWDVLSYDGSSALRGLSAGVRLPEVRRNIHKLSLRARIPVWLRLANNSVVDLARKGAEPTA
jgi:hypothetical protein